MSSNSRKRKNPGAGPRPLREVMLEAISKIEGRDEYGFFLKPVDAEQVPEYYRHIKSPMDFETMRKKVLKSRYASFSSLESDFRLIVTNCTYFNDRETIYHKEALKLRAAMDRLLPSFRSEAAAIAEAVAAERKAATEAKAAKSVPAAANSVIASTPAQEPGKRRKYIKSGMYKKTRDIGFELTAGLTSNDASGPGRPTPFDLYTVWRREQNLQRVGLVPFVQRVGRSLQGARVQPLFYLQHRPHRNKPFSRQYEARVTRFCAGMSERMRRRAVRKIKIAHGQITRGVVERGLPKKLSDDVRAEMDRVGKPADAGKVNLEGPIRVWGVTESELGSLKGIEGKAGDVISRMEKAIGFIARSREQQKRRLAEIAAQRAAAAKAAAEREAAAKAAAEKLAIAAQEKAAAVQAQRQAAAQRQVAAQRTAARKATVMLGNGALGMAAGQQYIFANGQGGYQVISAAAVGQVTPQRVVGQVGVFRTPQTPRVAGVTGVAAYQASPSYAVRTPNGVYQLVSPQQIQAGQIQSGQIQSGQLAAPQIQTPGRQAAVAAAKTMAAAQAKVAQAKVAAATKAAAAAAKPETKEQQAETPKPKES